MNYIKDFYGQNEFVKQIKSFLEDYKVKHLHEPYMLSALDEPSFINFNELYSYGEEASELVEVKRISDSESTEYPALYKLKKGGFAMGYIEDALMDYDDKRWITFNSMEELRWKYPIYEKRCDEHKGYRNTRIFTPKESEDTINFLDSFFETSIHKEMNSPYANPDLMVEVEYKDEKKEEPLSHYLSFYNTPIRNVKELKELMDDYGIVRFKNDKFNQKLKTTKNVQKKLEEIPR